MMSMRLLVFSHHLRRKNVLRYEIMGFNSASGCTINCRREFRTGNDASMSGHAYVPPPVSDGGGEPHIYLLPSANKRPPGPRTVEDFKNPMGAKKNWISYGISFTDYDSDRKEYHFFLGMSVIIFFVLIPFFRIYMPDQIYFFAPDRMWIHREARFELEKREKLGLPLVDPDYIPREQMKMPDKDSLEFLYRQDPDRWDSPGFERLGNRYDLGHSGDEMRRKLLWGDHPDMKPRLDKILFGEAIKKPE